jgi:hypothetical protein
MTNKEAFVSQYGNVYGQMAVTPIGRLALAHLVNPSTKFGTKYQASILFDKNDEKTKSGLNLILQDVARIIKIKWGDTPPAMAYPALRNGDEKAYQGFAGTLYISAKSDVAHRPQSVGPDRKPIDPAQLQNGMKVRFVITPTTFDQNGAGISWQLHTVMLIEDDGIRYFGGPDPLSLLSAVEGDGPVVAEVSTAVAASATPASAVATPRAGAMPLRGKAAALNNL